MIQILLALHAQCSQQFEAAIACLPPGHTQILVETLASQTGLPNTNDNIWGNKLYINWTCLSIIKIVIPVN